MSEEWDSGWLWSPTMWGAMQSETPMGPLVADWSAFNRPLCAVRGCTLPPEKSSATCTRHRKKGAYEVRLPAGDRAGSNRPPAVCQPELDRFLHQFPSYAAGYSEARGTPR